MAYASFFYTFEDKIPGRASSNPKPIFLMSFSFFVLAFIIWYFPKETVLSVLSCVNFLKLNTFALLDNVTRQSKGSKYLNEFCPLGHVVMFYEFHARLSFLSRSSDLNQYEDLKHSILKMKTIPAKHIYLEIEK